MKHAALKIAFSVVLATTLTSGAAQTQRQMYSSASALTKLSAAVEATVLYKEPSPLLTDDELLRLAAASNPSLLRELDGFKLRVRKEPQLVTLLVCTENADRALLEDASCTAKLDRHHWRDSATNPCAFTLATAEVCAP